MTRIKVCGMTSVADAELAVSEGAWAIGINHHRASPRYVEPALAVEIAAAVRRRCEVAGVFVNPSLAAVATAAEDEGLSIVQLHGDEGPAFCREVARRTGCPVIKAFRVRSSAQTREAEAYRVAYHMMDAYRPGIAGGTGESFDWELITHRRSRIPLIVAGGLNPENVGEAIEVTRPWAVDVASGVEAEPGRKDPDLIAAFAEAIRAAPRSGSRVA